MMMMMTIMTTNIMITMIMTMTIIAKTITIMIMTKMMIMITRTRTRTRTIVIVIIISDSIQSVKIFSSDIGMKLSIENCAVLVFKYGELVRSAGITLPNDTTIKAVEEVEGYKHLGVFEAAGNAS